MSCLYYEIPREDVVHCNIDRFLGMINPWNTYPYPLLKDRVDSLLLTIEGYNDDPRELHEIEEVRAFYRKLKNSWPEMLLYLQCDESMLVIFACNMNSMRCFRGLKPGKAQVVVDYDEIAQFLRRETRQLRQLMKGYGFTENEIDARVANIYRVLTDAKVTL